LPPVLEHAVKASRALIKAAAMRTVLVEVVPRVVMVFSFLGVS
jgi:hypothetical protein